MLKDLNTSLTSRREKSSIADSPILFNDIGVAFIPIMLLYDETRLPDGAWRLFGGLARLSG